MRPRNLGFLWTLLGGIPCICCIENIGCIGCMACMGCMGCIGCIGCIGAKGNTALVPLTSFGLSLLHFRHSNKIKQTILKKIAKEDNIVSTKPKELS